LKFLLSVHIYTFSRLDQQDYLELTNKLKLVENSENKHFQIRTENAEHYKRSNTVLLYEPSGTINGYDDHIISPVGKITEKAYCRSSTVVVFTKGQTHKRLFRF